MVAHDGIIPAPSGLPDNARRDSLAAAMGVVLLLLAGLVALFLKALMLPAALAACLLLWGTGGGIIWRCELRFRTVATAAMILLAQCALVLIGGEILARISGLAAPQRFAMFQPVEGAYYELRPNFSAKVPIQLTDVELRKVPVDISKQGLREEWVGEKAPNEIRVLCLGDSFTFGWGVDGEDSIPAQLELELKDTDPDLNWRVINAGVSGYSPWQALTWLRSNGLALAPDIVLLQTFVANDLADTLTQLEETDVWLRNERPFRVRLLNRFRHDDHVVMGLDNWLYRSSHLYYLACNRIDWDPILTRLSIQFRLMPTVSLAEAPEGTGAPVEYEVDRRESYPALDLAWRLFEADVAAMGELCDENDIHFVAYNIPFHFSAAEQDRFFANFPGVYDPDQGDRRAEALFEGVGIAFIPVVAWMREHPSIEAEYFPANLHLNEAGNQALAQHLAETLRATRHEAGASN